MYLRTGDLTLDLQSFTNMNYFVTGLEEPNYDHQRLGGTGETAFKSFNDIVTALGKQITTEGLWG